MNAAGNPPGHDSNSPGSTTYHGLPAIKTPVWTWEVPAYFYAGGAA